jgi:hypothetical protein
LNYAEAQPKILNCPIFVKLLGQQATVIKGANLQKKSFTYTQFYKNQITYQKPLRAEPTRLICTN